MEFEERLDVRAPLLRNRGRISADGGERVSERAALVAPHEPCLGHLPCHTAAADAGDPKANLLGEEIDDLEIMREDEPRSAKARATSSAAETPAMPSKRPPSGTVSECEPSMMVPGTAASRRDGR